MLDMVLEEDRGSIGDERKICICGFGAGGLWSDLPGDAGHEPDKPTQ
jgi:hypothetical protein